MKSKINGRIQIRIGNATDRQVIYRMRHSVYASELAQHSENEDLSLSDSLDEFNIYIYKIVFKKIYSNLDPKLQDIINNERK